jgi:hypothetical protein
MTLNRKNIIVYDLEIKKPIEQCSKGWASHDEMGISVGCAFDYRSMQFRVFMDDNIQELVARLNETDTIVVGFNHIGFDNKLLRASGFDLKPDSELKNYDMMLISKLGAGVKTFIKGFKLDDHLEALGMPPKTADGKEAPQMYQDGKLGQLVDYCLSDVIREKLLFEDMVLTGTTACAFNRTRYEIITPQLLY